MTTTNLIRTRQATHGDPARNLSRIQTVKETFRDGTNWKDLTNVHRECLEMFAVKIGRILEGDPNCEDHWADIAGYAEIGKRSCEQNVANCEQAPSIRRPDCRQIESQMGANLKPLPDGLPPLPEGAVYLGRGGEFDVPNSVFDGWACGEGAKDWGSWNGKRGDFHYAAPADSEIARLNGKVPDLATEGGRDE